MARGDASLAERRLLRGDARVRRVTVDPVRESVSKGRGIDLLIWSVVVVAGVASVSVGVWVSAVLVGLGAGAIVWLSARYSPVRIRIRNNEDIECWTRANPRDGKWKRRGPDRAGFLLAWWEDGCPPRQGLLADSVSWEEGPGWEWLDVDVLWAMRGSVALGASEAELLAALEALFVRVGDGGALVSSLVFATEGHGKAVVALGGIARKIGDDAELWESYVQMFDSCYGTEKHRSGQEVAALYEEAYTLLGKIGLLDE